MIRPAGVPAWRAGLLDEVDRAFESTGASTPGWPDPHEGREPAEEEYSRTLDPGKWRILTARLDAWVAVLVARDLASVEEAPADRWGREHDTLQLTRRRRLVPRRPGGLVLLAADTLVDGDLVGVDLAVEGPHPHPPRLVASLPPCGCDACDGGSAHELSELDECVLAVLEGDPARVADVGPPWTGQSWLVDAQH